MATIKLPKSLNDVEVNDFSPAAPGTYDLEVVKIESKVSQAGNPMLVARYKIINDPDYTGKMVFENISLAENALYTLKALALATGIDIESEFESDDFLGEQFTAVLDIEEYNGKEKNIVKRYEPK